MIGWRTEDGRTGGGADEVIYSKLQIYTHTQIVQRTNMYMLRFLLLLSTIAFPECTSSSSSAGGGGSQCPSSTLFVV